MPIEPFRFISEPEDPEAVIWRFMDFWKFEDLITTNELYFSRSDQLDDHNEGLPPHGVAPDLGLNPLDLRYTVQLNALLADIRRHRESFFVNCWYLAVKPSAAMWKEYGEKGVAIASRCSLLKSALDAGKDRAFLGVIRYGAGHLRGNRFNLTLFIFSKGPEFAHENELRALLYFPDQFRNDAQLTGPPANVAKFKRLQVALSSLITEIQVSAWATDATFSEVNRLVAEKHLTAPVRWSDLRGQ